MASKLRQKIEVYPFAQSPLASILKLGAVPSVSGGISNQFRQLEYIEQYLNELQCQSVVIERHYVDRDYMEDHSIFYSRNLYPYPNWCQRVHFFSVDHVNVKERLNELIQLGQDKGEREYRKACDDFSTEAYLGFSVIKPLHGSPVGRTVLKSYDQETGDGFFRRFPCTCVYKTHLYGLELAVRGLAFQQQDLGVSACATTALWSALQKARDSEDISLATPAQITMMASRYNLPFGRPMPQEGLTTDQMCQAVQALGISPYLFKADHFETARAYLYSTTASGFAAVLILRNVRNRNLYHAVTVAGMKLRTSHKPSFTPGGVLDDRAGDLAAIYVHDDRTGPYLRMDLRNKRGRLQLDASDYKTGCVESWTLTHILIPMHGKIRLSFGSLRDQAISISKFIDSYRQAYLGRENPKLDLKDYTLTFETLIARSHIYIEDLLFGASKLHMDKLERLRRVILARYLGIVRISSVYLGDLAILFDTTSTERNVHCVAIISRPAKTKYTERIAKVLSDKYGCAYIV